MRSRVSWMVALVVVLVSGVVGCGSRPDAPQPTTPVAVTPTETPVEEGESTQIAVVAMVGVPEAVGVGETFEVEVSASGVADLYGAEVHLTFDPSLLEVVDDRGNVAARVADGDLLVVRFTAQNAVDHAQGRVDYAVSQMPPSKGVTGYGALVRVRFRAKAAGAADISLDEVLLASSLGEAIPWAGDGTRVVVTVR
jgi:hypothetical protein